MTEQNYNVDPTATQALLADADKELPGSGSKNKDLWVKLDEGTHEFRVIPCADGTWFRKQVSHRMLKHPKGFNVMPTSLRYVFGVESILKLAIDAGKITRQDGELYERYGCPLDQLRINLYEQEQDDEAKKFFPREQYIVNVIHVDGPGADLETIKMYSLNQKRFDTLRATVDANPGVFNTTGGQNFRIEAKGPRNFERRYGPIIFVPATDITIPEGQEPNDLDAAVAKGIRGFDELVALVATNQDKYPLVTRLGAELAGYFAEQNSQGQVPADISDGADRLPGHGAGAESPDLHVTLTQMRPEDPIPF